MPVVEESLALVERVIAGPLEPNSGWGVAAKILGDGPNDSVWDPELFMAVDTLSPALTQLTRLSADAPHRISDPRLASEVAELVEAYQAFASGQAKAVIYPDVAFIEAGDGTRVEVAMARLFEEIRRKKDKPKM